MHESLKKLAIPVLHYLFRGRTGTSGLLGYLRPATKQKDRVICGIFYTAAFLERADGVFCMHCIRYVHLILVGIGPGPFQIEIDRAFGSRDII